MPGVKPKIATHPDREKIDQDLIEGKSNREVARSYGLSEKAVRNYLRTMFAEGVVRAQKARQVNADEFIYEQLMEQLELARRLQRAAAKWLEDPDDPDTFTMEPRDWEIEVIYQDPDHPEVTRRDTLDRLLTRTGKTIYNVNNGAMDNRAILLKTFDSMARQLQVWMRARENAQKEQRREAIQEFLNLFVPALMEATDGKQELRRTVGDALRSVRHKLLGE